MMASGTWARQLAGEILGFCAGEYLNLISVPGQAAPDRALSIFFWYYKQIAPDGAACNRIRLCYAVP